MKKGLWEKEAKPRGLTKVSGGSFSGPCSSPQEGTQPHQGSGLGSGEQAGSQPRTPTAGGPPAVNNLPSPTRRPRPLCCFKGIFLGLFGFQISGEMRETRWLLAAWGAEGAPESEAPLHPSTTRPSTEPGTGQMLREGWRSHTE